MIPAPELERMLNQHVSDYWSTPGRDVNVTVELMKSFGIDSYDMVRLAGIACENPQLEHTHVGRTAIFMQGFLLGLDLARQLESDSLRVEADHFREAAVRYGRVLQALVGRNGGPLELEQEDMLNDSTLVVVEQDGDTIRVVLEELPGGG